MKYTLIFVITVFILVQKGSTMNVLENENLNFYKNLYNTRSNFSYLKQRRDREAKNLPPCNEDQLLMYLAEIQAINPENIINLSTLEDLNDLCKKVSESLSKMDGYLKSCEPPQQKDLYIQLIKGVDSLYEKLCAEGKFKKDFQLHYQCFHQLHNDLQDCNGSADWTEDEDDAKVCKAYHEIADCYYIKTAKLCGTEAANLMKDLMLAVTNSVLTINCVDVKKNPRVDEPMPDESDTNNSNVFLGFVKQFMYPVFYYLPFILFIFTISVIVRINGIFSKSFTKYKVAEFKHYQIQKTLQT